MNRETGKRLDDRAHLVQSIQMILETPKGSRVMRPTFGSNVYKYLAGPMDTQTNLRIAAEVIDALSRWEPRLTVDQVDVVERDPRGILTLSIIGEYESRFFRTDIQARFEG